MKYVLALDQGTTSSRAVLYDQDGVIQGLAQREFEQIYPCLGWVEHDPEEIWASQIGVAVEALSRANARPRHIAAVGIANQRETTILWERKTGNRSTMPSSGRTAARHRSASGSRIRASRKRSARRRGC